MRLVPTKDSYAVIQEYLWTKKLKEKDPKDSQIQKLDTAQLSLLVKEVKALPNSEARDAFLSYVKEAANDDIITQLEYHEIERLGDEVYLSNQTTKIKALVSD